MALYTLSKMFNESELLNHYRMSREDAILKAKDILRVLTESEVKIDALDNGACNLLHTVNPERLLTPFYMYFDELFMPQIESGKMYKCATFALRSHNGEFFQILYVDFRCSQACERLDEIFKYIVDFLRDKNKLQFLLAVVSDRNPINYKIPGTDINTIWDFRHFMGVHQLSHNEELQTLYSQKFRRTTYDGVFEIALDQNATYPVDFYKSDCEKEIKMLHSVVEQFFRIDSTANTFKLQFCTKDHLENVGRRWKKAVSMFIDDEKKNEIWNEKAFEKDMEKVYPRLLSIWAAFEFKGPPINNK